MNRNFKFQISNFKLNKGFSLIELLIVVSIIGVLSSLLTTNYIGIRQRARDAQRKSDLRQIQSALEIYRADQGSYPDEFSGSGVYRLNPSGCSGGPVDTLTAGGSTYMQLIPCPPSSSAIYNGTAASNYYYYSTGSIYTLAACLENSNDSQGTSTGPTPAPTANGSCSSSKYYIVNNP